MSRYLFVLWEGGGNVPPQLGIARRLVARGHEVHVLGDPDVEPAARAAGAAFARFVHAPRHNLRDRERDQVRDWAPRSPLAQLARTTGEVMFGPAARYARDVLAAVERLAPDALAVDWMLFGALVAAEKSGLPTAVLMHTPYALPSPAAPPFGLGLRPARGWLGRLRDRLLRAIVVRIFERQGGPPVAAARASLGLPPLGSLFEQPVRADRVLVLTLAATDFAARGPLPENVVYVGPQLDDPVWAAPWCDGGGEAPLVLVSLGSTYQAQGAAVQRVIDALARLPARGLVTLGGVVDAGELRLPANVVAVESAPHHAVMPRARAVVCHGGHGTVMKALSHGAPVLAVPHGRDQADNAARVVEAGAGLRVGPRASVRALRAALARLLDEPGFAAAARRVAGDIARDVAADRAVAELEGLVREVDQRVHPPGA